MFQYRSDPVIPMSPFTQEEAEVLKRIARERLENENQSYKMEKLEKLAEELGYEILPAREA